jgi:FlaA1/EpsC-like NDP-sugar epimerase
MMTLGRDREQLEMLVTGREDHLFEDDLKDRKEELTEAFGGSVLVLGGAGSVGSATVKKIVDYSPERLHVIDQDENGLVELVRDLRSRPGGLDVEEFRTFPIDLGSRACGRLVRELGPYDRVLNFAAVKHVRSEKDVYTTLQMLDTNLIRAARLQAWIGEAEGCESFFSVSSDKAVNPASVMGATKRAMEHLLFAGNHGGHPPKRVTSARFANVAFSGGSLLEGFLNRVEKQQPIAVPKNVKRYFISSDEAGSLCILAAAIAPHRHILVPRLNAEEHLIPLVSIARQVVGALGFEPYEVEDEDIARKDVATLSKEGRWPVLLTPLDTSGEKPYEEFSASNEEISDIGLHGAQAVGYVPDSDLDIDDAVRRLEAMLDQQGTQIEKATIVSLLKQVVPRFAHVETRRTLDDRM